jgi:hypothetical protein
LIPVLETDGAVRADALQEVPAIIGET